MGRQRRPTPKAAEAEARVWAKNQSRWTPLKRSTDSGAITDETVMTGVTMKTKPKALTAVRITEKGSALSPYEKKIAENVAQNKSLLESLGLGGGNPLGIPETMTHKGHHANVSKAPDNEDYEPEQDDYYNDKDSNYDYDGGDGDGGSSTNNNDEGYDVGDGNTDYHGHGSNDMYTEENEGNIVEISSSAWGPRKAQVSRGPVTHLDHTDGNAGTGVAHGILPSLSDQLLWKSMSSMLKRKIPALESNDLNIPDRQSFPPAHKRSRSDRNIESFPPGMHVTAVSNKLNEYGHDRFHSPMNSIIRRSMTHDTPSGAHHQSHGVSYPRSSSPPDSTISSSVPPAKPVRMTTMLYWKQHEDPQCWIVIDTAIFFFHSLLVAGNPFGNDTQLRAYAWRAFETALGESGSERDEQIDVTGEMITTVIKTTSSFRSRFKEAAQGAVPTYYGFRDLPTSDDVAAIVQGALKDENFTFREFDIEMDTRSGALQHPCIFPVIRGFFSLGKRTKKHIGRLHRLMDIFIPMRAEMIAFALTVIQNILHCWESGTEKPVDFSADTYGNIFNGHLQWINAWKAKHPDQWRIVAEDLGKAAANTCGYADTHTLVGKPWVMRDDD